MKISVRRESGEKKPLGYTGLLCAETLCPMDRGVSLWRGRECREGELNPHAVNGTRPLILRVCQFHHLGIEGKRAFPCGKAGQTIAELARGSQEKTGRERLAPWRDFVFVLWVYGKI